MKRNLFCLKKVKVLIDCLTELSHQTVFDIQLIFIVFLIRIILSTAFRVETLFSALTESSCKLAALDWT